MRALVAYYSKFGNGKLIAEAIGKGLQETGLEVTVTEVGTKGISDDYDLVVLSSPTRAGRMMGPAKRFIGELKTAAWKGKSFIAVGTGFKPKGTGGKFDEFGARSADKSYEALAKAGPKPLMEAQKFYVEEMKGPLLEGEEERALELGRTAGRALGGATS